MATVILRRSCMTADEVTDRKVVIKQSGNTAFAVPASLLGMWAFLFIIANGVIINLFPYYGGTKS